MENWAVYLNVGITILNIIFFIAVVNKDPGYLKKPEAIEFQTMLEKIDSTQLCPECETIRTSRSRHCTICGRCIERYDHHCPWVNNCIGVGNHNVFYLYIVTQFMVLLTAFSQCVIALNMFIHNEPFVNEYATGIIPYHLLRSNDFFLPFLLYLIALTGFFMLAIALLLFMQTTNYMVGKTTTERVGYKAGAMVDHETRI